MRADARRVIGHTMSSLSGFLRAFLAGLSFLRGRAAAAAACRRDLGMKLRGRLVLGVDNTAVIDVAHDVVVTPRQD